MIDNSYKNRISKIQIDYEFKKRELEKQIDELKQQEEKEIKDIRDECWRNGGHKDDGGMFFASCERCGYTTGF